MHFMKGIDPMCLGAEHFVDINMNPISVNLKIAKVTLEKPPAGGKEKLCFYFEGKEKKAFFANTQVKKLARTLRIAETDKWAGTEITVTAREVRFGKSMVMGMLISHINGKEVN